MTGTDDNTSDEFGVFIGADGQRLTDAPWRLQAFDQAGPLSASQIADLARRFGLEVEALGKLSERLGYVLNPSTNVHVIPASRSSARAAAEADISDARRQLTVIQSTLSKVIGRLSLLTLEHDDDESPHTPIYAEMRTNLEDGLKSLGQAQAILEAPDGPMGRLVRWEPLDRRELSDRRRNEVLDRLSQFWFDQGRKVSFTTDPLTSMRGGDLVLFAQAVCLLLTDPATEIPAETIVKRIREWGKNCRPTPDWALRFPTPDELRSVLNAPDD
jgi:hypothetical protein